MIQIEIGLRDNDIEKHNNPNNDMSMQILILTYLNADAIII